MKTLLASLALLIIVLLPGCAFFEKKKDNKDEKVTAAAPKMVPVTAAAVIDGVPTKCTAEGCPLKGQDMIEVMERNGEAFNLYRVHPNDKGQYVRHASDTPGDIVSPSYSAPATTATDKKPDAETAPAKAEAKKEKPEAEPKTTESRAETGVQPVPESAGFVDFTEQEKALIAKTKAQNKKWAELPLSPNELFRAVYEKGELTISAKPSPDGPAEKQLFWVQDRPGKDDSSKHSEKPGMAEGRLVLRKEVAENCNFLFGWYWKDAQDEKHFQDPGYGVRCAKAHGAGDFLIRLVEGKPYEVVCLCGKEDCRHYDFVK